MGIRTHHVRENSLPLSTLDTGGAAGEITRNPLGAYVWRCDCGDAAANVTLAAARATRGMHAFIHKELAQAAASLAARMDARLAFQINHPGPPLLHVAP